MMAHLKTIGTMAGVLGLIALVIYGLVNFPILAPIYFGLLILACFAGVYSMVLESFQ